MSSESNLPTRQRMPISPESSPSTQPPAPTDREQEIEARLAKMPFGYFDAADHEDIRYLLARVRSLQAENEKLPVHNHGSEDGPGLACREQRVDGRLVGDCLAPRPTTVSDETAKEWDDTYYNEVQAVSALLVEHDGHTHHPSISSHVAEILARLDAAEARSTQPRNTPMTEHAAAEVWKAHTYVCFACNAGEPCPQGRDILSDWEKARQSASNVIVLSQPPVAAHPIEAPANG